MRQLGAIALQGNGPKLTHGAGFKLSAALRQWVVTLVD
jgi:hypothetical protein